MAHEDTQEADRARRDTISDALRRAARRHRDRTALSFAERHWSFAALDRAADRVAAGLLAAGLSRGDRLGALGRNSDAYLILWLACARAGIIHVPINYALTGRELRYVVEQSGAACLIVDPALAGNAREALAPLPRRGSAPCSAAPASTCCTSPGTAAPPSRSRSPSPRTTWCSSSTPRAPRRRRRAR